MLFEHLKLIEPVLKALKSEGYSKPTPIQLQAIPLVLERRDLLGVAQTGTGKTAAFAIPVIQLLTQDKNISPGKRVIRCLVLTPTRELAIQIGESFKSYGVNTPLKYSVIFGGVNQHAQVMALRSGVDVLIATPGRLLDLMNQKHVHLNDLNFFVLDEADRMLDMGFIHDVKRVLAHLPRRRQSLFFSATMPPEIVNLANSILTNPVKVEVTPPSTTVEMINQEVYFVDKPNKRHLLLQVLKESSIERALVFTRTKHGADKVAKELIRAGVNAQAIHGNKSQNARQNALNNFRSKVTRVLVATDIAARGIDIDDLTHVVNFELPNVPESYVHRIGRTGRAGASGTAIAFCDAEEKAYLRDIQKLIGKSIPVRDDHKYPLQNHTVLKQTKPQRPSRNSNPNNKSVTRVESKNNGQGHTTTTSFKSKKNRWFGGR
ncbi:MAG: DEAD/DEAH box helicase [Cyclobacteriaceae bacterium]|jgi:ATP-dependent RNA helicase RhlE|nr:DEAD/DEAH box helicase [Cyclobacteriaceae bacterium]